MHHLSGHVSNRQVISSYRKVTVKWRLARASSSPVGDTDTPHGKVSHIRKMG